MDFITEVRDYKLMGASAVDMAGGVLIAHLIGVQLNVSEDKMNYGMVGGLVLAYFISKKINENSLP